MSERAEGCATVLGGLALWGIIIWGCAGFVSCDDKRVQDYKDRAAVPLHRYADQNDYKVKVLYLTEGLEGGKFKHVVIHCVVEGLRTKERKILKIETHTDKIPLPNEIWKIKVDRDHTTILLESKEE
jgi:hypothetical protein